MCPQSSCHAHVRSSFYHRPAEHDASRFPLQAVAAQCDWDRNQDQYEERGCRAVFSPGDCCPRVVCGEDEDGASFGEGDVVAERVAIGTGKPEVIATEGTVVTGETAVATTEPEVTAAEPEVTAAESKVAAKKPTVATTGAPITTTEPVVATTEPAVATTELEVTTAEPETATKEPAVATTDASVATTESAVTTAEPAGVETEPAVITSELAVATTESTIITAEPAVITAEPAVITAETSEAKVEPTVTITEPIEVITEPADTTLHPAVTTTESSVNGENVFTDSTLAAKESVTVSEEESTADSGEASLGSKSMVNANEEFANFQESHADANDGSGSTNTVSDVDKESIQTEGEFEVVYDSSTDVEGSSFDVGGKFEDVDELAVDSVEGSGDLENLPTPNNLQLTISDDSDSDGLQGDPSSAEGDEYIARKVPADPEEELAGEDFYVPSPSNTEANSLNLDTESSDTHSAPYDSKTVPPKLITNKQLGKPKMIAQVKATPTETLDLQSVVEDNPTIWNERDSSSPHKEPKEFSSEPEPDSVALQEEQDELIPLSVDGSDTLLEHKKTV